MKWSLFISLLLVLLTSCAPQLKGYRFSMDESNPTESNANYTFDASAMHYSDDMISVRFYVSETFYKGVDGFSQYDNYEGVSFTLRNLTDSPMIIDWNLVSFTDYMGRSGNAVMHSGIKYSQCNEYKPPSSVPPKGTISDIIIPCYGLSFVPEAISSMKWQSRMLPNPTKMPEVQFGIFLPVKIGNEVINYNFSFRGVWEK